MSMKITGRKFDLDEQNKVAKLIYMGELDNNDALMYNDAYGNVERELLKKLFGANLNQELKIYCKYISRQAERRRICKDTDTGRTIK